MEEDTPKGENVKMETLIVEPCQETNGNKCKMEEDDCSQKRFDFYTSPAFEEVVPLLDQKDVDLLEEEMVFVYMINDSAQNNPTNLSMEHRESYENAYLCWKTKRRNILNEKISHAFEGEGEGNPK